MKYHDLIHGVVEIDEPIIIDLISSPSLQRLKGIDQAGYSQPYFPNTKHTRFEHSLGDYLLLKQYGASLEEQVNGLIHDVSHSAFSHCIDYVLDAGSQETHDLQDNIFNEYVTRTEIPSILEKHGLDVSYILNEKNFPLQETNLPDLCADRIDYSLRTAIIFKESDPEEVKEILSHLFVSEDNKWVFDNRDFARRYAEIFLQMNNKYYSGLPSGVMFLTVGDYLRHALREGYIIEHDLYRTDQELLDLVKFHHSHDDRLMHLFNRMDRKIQAVEDKDDYYSKVSCKSRVVDPLFLEQGEIYRLSDRDYEWKSIMEKYLSPKEYFIRFVE